MAGGLLAVTQCGVSDFYLAGVALCFDARKNKLIVGNEYSLTYGDVTNNMRLIHIIDSGICENLSFIFECPKEHFKDHIKFTQYKAQTCTEENKYDILYKSRAKDYIWVWLNYSPCPCTCPYSCKCSCQCIDDFDITDLPTVKSVDQQE